MQTESIKIATRDKLSFLIIWGLLLFVFWSILPQNLFPHHHFSSAIFDKKGDLLSASVSIDEQWHFPAKTSISQKYKTAAIHFEDKRFYNHGGYDLIALSRAIVTSVKAGRIVSGGSTITMQTIRLHRNNPPRTFLEKFREIILANRLEWRFSKEEIFRLYSQHAPYGGNVIGIDAASWRYFSKSAEFLSWGEATFLAVLPNSPGLIHTEKNRDKLLKKRNKLLYALNQSGKITNDEYQSAITEIIPRRPVKINNYAPHLLQFLVSKNGKDIYKTSINKDIQKRCLEIASVQGRQLKENHIDNVSILVLDIETNETVAYVGNLPNTGSNNQEFVDMVQAKRSTGSLLKPFLYVQALDEGLIMEKSILPDFPFEMSGFTTENYDKRHYGMIPANQALRRSLNIPFAYLLKEYGIGKFLHNLSKFGITSINNSPDHYGTPLILGGAEASLWELTNAFGRFGKIMNTYEKSNGFYADQDKSNCSIIRTEESLTTPVFQNYSNLSSAPAVWTTLHHLQQVERPVEQGRWQKFSSTHKIAWKTGTSNGFKDAWAIGVNGKYAIGVWVGNADGEGRPGIVGAKAAAPIFFRVVNSLGGHRWWQKPIDDMQQLTVCARSGNLAQAACPVDSLWVKTMDNPLPICSYHKHIFVDQTGQFSVAADCYDMELATEKTIFEIPTSAAYYYGKHHYVEKKPPNHPNCGVSTNDAGPRIIYPEPGIKIYLPKVDSNIRNQFVLRSFHPDEKAQLHWHIDDKFVSTTSQIHEIHAILEPGKHRLIVVDLAGVEDVVDFEILE